MTRISLKEPADQIRRGIISKAVRWRTSHGRYCVRPALGLCFALLIITWFAGCGGGGESHIKGDIHGFVTDVTTQAPIQGATIQTAPGTREATTQSNGSFFLSLSAGVYTLSVEAQGYIPVEIPDVHVVEGEGTARNITLESDGTNTPPNPPVLIFPSDAANEISLKPELQTETFSDTDPSAIHTKSHWQIATDLSFTEQTVIVDVISPYTLDTLKPEFILEPNTTYYWRVRFYDDFNAGSNWSNSSSFTTATDTDLDGIPDQWEQFNGLDPTIDDAMEDPDGDGFNNLEEYYFDGDPFQAPAPNGSDPIMGFVRGSITNSCNDAPVEAQILTSGSIVCQSLADGNYFMVHPTGVFSVVVSAEDYYKGAWDDIVVLEASTEHFDMQLHPIQSCVGGGSGGGGCFINSILACAR